MANFRGEIDHLYTTLDANMQDTSRIGALSNLDSLADIAELGGAGVYFLFEPGEKREAGGPRVVRVGKANNLRERLYGHRNNAPPSAFFTLIWSALAYMHTRAAFYPFLRTGWNQIP